MLSEFGFGRVLTDLAEKSDVFHDMLAQFVFTIIQRAVLGDGMVLCLLFMSFLLLEYRIPNLVFDCMSTMTSLWVGFWVLMWALIRG